jgi:hypothetical protein
MVFGIFQTIALNSCSPTKKTGITSVVSGGEAVPVQNKPIQIQTQQEEGEEDEEEEEEDEGNAMEPVAGRLEIRVLDRAEGSAVVETVNNNVPPPVTHVPTKRPELNEVEEHHVKGKKHFECTRIFKVELEVILCMSMEAWK